MTQTIHIEKWSNQAQAYESVGILFRDDQGATGFTYNPSYAGPPLDPVHLNYQTAQRRSFVSVGRSMFSVFQDALPGAFAYKVLAAAKPEIRKMSSFDILVALGSRDLGALKMTVQGSPLQYAHRGNSDAHSIERMKALSKGMIKPEDVSGEVAQNLFALTALKGAMPKTTYTDKQGSEWIIKGQPDYESVAIPNIEHALTVMQKEAGIRVVENRLARTRSGEVVLASKRYDKQNPIVDSSGRPTGLFKDQYAKMSFQAVLGHNDPNQVFKFEHLANVIESMSAHGYEDRVELFRRMIFHVCSNNTDNNLHNFEMMLTDHGWRLSPSYDVTPALTRGSFVVEPNLPKVDGRYQLSVAAILDAAKQLEIDPEDALVAADNVFAVMEHARQFLTDSKVPERDIEQCLSVFPDRAALISLQHQINEKLEQLHENQHQSSTLSMSGR